MPATPIAVSGAPEAAVQLIQHALGVEIRAVDESSASGRDNGGQVVSLRDLRQLGQTDKTALAPAAREAAKRCASDALSEAGKRAYTRKLRLIAHCKALFVSEPNTAKKEIFGNAARITFEEEQKRAGDNLNMCAAKPFSARTVQTVWRTYERSNRDVRSQMPRFRDRGRKMAALKDKVNLLVRATLYELWSTEKPVGIEQVQRAVETEIKRRSAAGEDGFVGRKAPSQRSIYRVIWRDETLSEHLRIINNRPQPKSVGLHEIAERPLEMAETDETHFDFKVRDSVTGQTGMPSVLLICDQRTGMPLGRNVGIGAANAERARLMMLNAIEPKSPIKFVGGMQFVSPARGLMNAVTGDLGAIFTADDFVLPLADLGIETASTPPRMPELKGRIENLNGVVKSWMRMRRRGASPEGRPRGEEGNEVDGADEVVMSLEEFERRVDLTLARYALHPHKNLANETPLDCFNRLTKDDEPRMPEREHDLLVLGRRAKAQVTREGASHRGVHFRSRALDDILRRPDNEGRRYEIAEHPRHFNSIILLHPDGYWIPLYRADQPEAAGRSPSVFTAHKRQMAQHARNDPERNALLRSIDQETARPLRQRRSQPPAPTPITATPTLSTPSLPAVANDDDFFDPLAEEMPCRPTARIF